MLTRRADDRLCCGNTDARSLNIIDDHEFFNSAAVCVCARMREREREREKVRERYKTLKMGSRQGPLCWGLRADRLEEQKEEMVCRRPGTRFAQQILEP